MQNNDDSNSGSTPLGLATHNKCGNLPSPDLHLHLENQDNPQLSSPDGTDATLFGNSTAEAEANPTLLNINAISNADSHVIHVDSRLRDSPKKEHLSRTESSHDQCRVCQQEKEEVTINLGCKCKGGLAKAHRSCIDTWFRTRGSNKCEICQEVAANVLPPESQPSTNYWVWRIDPTFRPRDPEMGCFSPLWVAFSILIGGLLLDVLISITLGVSALPVNIIIGIIVVLGLGTALRLALEFCHEWSFRRVVQRVDSNVPPGYHPAL